MADDLVLYTSPMSRGRIAPWMLEEVGRPPRTAGLASPIGDTARAPYFRGLFFADGPLEHAITTANLGVAAPPETGRPAYVRAGELDDAAMAEG